MIMRYGMSEKLGPRVLGRNQDMPFLGREMAAEADYSEDLAREIDGEIRRVIEEAHVRARKVLEEHIDELHRLSQILVERETIDKDQFLKLLEGAPEEQVFPEEATEAEPEKPKADERRKRVPKPKPFPLPGQAMQPPDPEGAKG
jgi:cell division protease FtsH